MEKIKKAPKKSTKKLKKPLKEQIKEETKKPIKEYKKEKEPPIKFYIPTGSTMLNLACSGTKEGGWGTGRIGNLIGDSNTGKTILSLTALADTCYDERFDEYQLILDDVEHAFSFDVENMYSKKVAKRLLHNNNVDQSDLFEDWRNYISDLLDAGKPFIYFLDCLDALQTEAERKKTKANKNKRQQGEKEDGSYGDGKAKLLSQFFRSIKTPLSDIDSSIIIISQTRDDLTSKYRKKSIRSGGRALKFYSTHEMWLEIDSPITKKDIAIGSDVTAKVTKNKVTGKKREVYFPVYDHYGVDDISSMIDFLIDHKFWTMEKQTINAAELGYKFGKEKLIKSIEQHNLREDLKQITEFYWNELEDSVKLDRKPKYA